MIRDNVKKFIIFALFGALLAFLFRWKLFVTDGIVGHNWDWNIPYLKEQNIYAIFTFLFNWNESSFSSFTSPRIGNIVLYLFGALINGSFQSKLLLFAVPFLSLLNSWILLKFLSNRFLNSENDLGVVLGSLIYAFSSSVFNDFIGGQLIFLLGYCFIPLNIYFVFKYFEDKVYLKYIFPIVVTFFIFSGSHHWYFSLGILLTIYIFFYKRNLKKFILILSLAILVTAFNFFFILSQANNVSNIMPSSLKNEEWFFKVMRSQTQTIDKVFVGASFGDRNMDLKSLENNKTIFFVFSYILLIFILGNLFLNIKYYKNRKIIYWASFIYLSGLFLVTAGRPPLGDFFILLMKKILVFRGFRTVFHFFVLPNFAYSILAAISISVISKQKKIIPILTILLFLLSRLPFFITGDNGRESLQRQKKDSLDIYKINQNYLKIIRQQFQDPVWYRVLSIPTTISPVYIKTPYQEVGQGADPEIIYSPKPILNDFTLTGSTNIIYDYIENNVIDNNPINQKLLGFLSFKNIIFRKDIHQSFSSQAGRYNEKDITKKLSELNKKLASEYINYYDIDSNFFVPHLYIPNKMVYFSGDIKELIKFISSNDYDLKSAINFNDIGLKKNTVVKADNYQEYIINGELLNNINKEDLATFHTIDKIQLPYSPIKPGTYLYSLALIREKMDINNSSKSTDTLMDKYLFYANKRIAEILIYKLSPGKLIELVGSYGNNMEKAIDILEKIKTENPENYPEKFSLIKDTLRLQKKKYEEIVLDNKVSLKVEKIFKNLNERVYWSIDIKDMSKFEYSFFTPKEGVYDIYFYTEEKDPSGNNWKFLESKYFSQGKQRYDLRNDEFGQNLVSDNLKINNYSPNTVFKISLNYKTLSEKAVLSVNEVKESGRLDFELPATEDNYKLATIFFKSSRVDKAFITVSVSEYENLRVEKIKEPKILLRSNYTMTENDSNNSPQISFSRINPIKYEVEVKNAKYPYNLILGESFDSGWKLYLKGGSTLNYGTDRMKSIYFYIGTYGGKLIRNFLKNKAVNSNSVNYFDGKVEEVSNSMQFLGPETFETWTINPVLENFHFLANGYANGWSIIPQDFQGESDYNLIIEYEPQKLYYLGIFTSFMVLFISLLGLLLFIILKLIRTKNNCNLNKI